MPKAERHDPLHEQIAAHYKAGILAGRTRTGDRLPSVREIAGEWEVGQETAQRAIGLLKDAGLVRTVPGHGTFVTAAARKAVELLGQAEESAAAEVDAARDGHEGFSRAGELAEAWQQSAARVRLLRDRAAERIVEEEATILAPSLARDAADPDRALAEEEAVTGE